MYWLLFYVYIDDMLDRRAPFREAHLALARDAHRNGTLLLAGATTDPLDGAVFVFRADDRSAIDEFVRDDPYVREGLVRAWKVCPWNVVIGADRRW